MQTHRLTGLLVLFASLFSHASLPCASVVPACFAYQSSTLVFRGRVLDISPRCSATSDANTSDGSKSEPCYYISDGYNERIHLQVIETFKGDPGREITVLGDGPEFRTGDEYLVFVTIYGTYVSVTGCTPTGPVDSPSTATALAWLRAYPTAPPTSSLFGVEFGMRDAPSITIDLSGEKNATTSTDKDHSYTFNNLPPGTYTVTAVLPDGYMTKSKNPVTVTVAAKGCAEVNWTIRPNSHITGHVTDATGNSAPNIAVSLLNADPNKSGSILLDTRRTNRDGNYDFSQVAPGDYRIALNYLGPSIDHPYIPGYYPLGNDDPSTAEIIHLGSSESKENINIVLTPLLHSVTLHVRVVNSDGTPVARANFTATNRMTPHQAISATADADGNAEITLLEGQTYSLIASNSGNIEPACAGPVKFTAKEGLHLETMTLDKTWNQCRALQRTE